MILITIGLIVLSIVVVFNNVSKNQITGNDIVNTKVELFPVQYKNCSFQLNPGWNMVSFYCFGLFVERNKALQSLGDTYNSLFMYQANDINDPWKSYNPGLPNWTIQQLNYMDRVSGYWINMNNESNFSYAGVYSDSNIYVYNRWNLVGFPSIATANISDSLTDVSFDMVKYYNTTIDTWLTYIVNDSNNTLNQFNTYNSYWIKVNGDQIWTIAR